MKQGRLILLFIFIILSTESFSQYDFRKGFEITNNQDTIHGLIYYTPPESRTQVYTFKKDEFSKISHIKCRIKLNTNITLPPINQKLLPLHNHF